MKNLIKISLIAVTFLVVSCNKEIIRPNSSVNDEEIVLKSMKSNYADKNKDNFDPGITDPNNDPDMNIKKVVVIKAN